ncbi:cellulose binding domain-containing protein [Streptomyces sp. TRM S81-3]|uniref:Cellulose binding domain-containing protein n=1 Tax=Streptomyces griseicoloratus TaxID=2752516 RepID=A0A926LC29_9ACTN|nr:cellulose-binding domain-containing protein [Streptomyces griseicoloratus]MBD0424774.1 cellulose binding domain-containing protein [Streptomyces griseicoloratus]
MPDLPSPEDAAEAPLPAECWDAVLSYAGLCTAGTPAATRLATEAFARGMRELRAAAAPTARRAGGRPARLPRIPLLLTAVRTTAAAWEDGGQGHDLDPGLRRWLHSEAAARHAGPPSRRPLAPRVLRDMPARDAELLWLADVEALPLPVVARRLGLDPATAPGALARARDLFRDRCRQVHLDASREPGCRDRARLPATDARTPAAGAPDDLAGCDGCAEAAACPGTHGGALPAALAGGVLGWGGPAYLELRRRAAEARLGAGRPGPADDDGDAVRDTTPACTLRARLVRGGLLVTAALVSLVALTVSLRPFGGTAEDPAAADGTAAGRAPADPGPARPSPAAGLSSGSREPSSGTPKGGTRGTAPDDRPAGTTGPRTTPSGTAASGTVSERPANSDPEPQGSPSDATTGSGTGSDDVPDPGTTAPATCRVRYDLVTQWPDGFQATVTVTTGRPLDSWRVAWTFPDGQRIRQMWDATHTHDGSRVTATATGYNATVPAGGSLAFGFLASWRGRNSPPDDFTLNGRECDRA